MDHREITKTHAVERYLLGEMDEHERESFEEHYFDCASCSQDVLTAQIFQANLRAYFADQARERGAGPSRGFSLRPLQAIAAAVFLAVLSLGAYQNLVVIPELQARLDSPSAVQQISLKEQRRGAELSASVQPGVQEAVLKFDKTWELESKGWSEYRIECSGESGVAFVMTLPETSPGEPLQVSVPVKLLPPGEYSFKLYGLDAGGATELRVYELRIEQ